MQRRNALSIVNILTNGREIEDVCDSYLRPQFDSVMKGIVSKSKFEMKYL